MQHFSEAAALDHTQGLGAHHDRVKSASSDNKGLARVCQHHARQRQGLGLSEVNVAYNPNCIASLAVDAQGTVWAATWGGGLAKIKPS